jgi:hypothetical protein
MMKKIDILNFITNFRKAPNDIKTRTELLEHVGANNEAALQAMLLELEQSRVLKEVDMNGEKAYKVVTK